MKMIHALCCSLLLASGAFAQRPAKEAHALVGTWRLVEFADLDQDGKWQYWYGEHPLGYFVYDATGHVHVQIMRIPALKPFPESNFDAGKMPSPEHALAAYTGYVANFGTYAVDARSTSSRFMSRAAWRRITSTRTSRVPSNWKATDWRSPTARPGGACWCACADFLTAASSMRCQGGPICSCIDDGAVVRLLADVFAAGVARPQMASAWVAPAGQPPGQLRYTLPLSSGLRTADSGCGYSIDPLKDEMSSE